MSLIQVNEQEQNLLESFEEASKKYREIFSSEHTNNARYFLAPGRSEIGGNHTDHQHGKVIVAAVNVNTIALAEKRDDFLVKLYSEGFGPIEVDLSNLEIVENEKERSEGIIKGVAKGLVDRGQKIGGFQAYVNSEVPKGSGLSSSASFELLIIQILQNLFNEEDLSAIENAKIGQFAENVYFGKPSGLLDQAGSSVGALTYIDFSQETIEAEKLSLDLAKEGYSMCIIITGSDHADLTDAYSAIPEEMKAIAKHFNKSTLVEVDPQDFYASIKDLRESVGDRAILRAMHFFQEQERVDIMKTAILDGEFSTFLNLVNSSGLSSELLLQNVRVEGDKKVQDLSLALAITRQFLDGKSGACRVHGGGFAGTIQAYIRKEDVDTYREKIEAVFGPGACLELSIQEFGACEVKL